MGPVTYGVLLEFGFGYSEKQKRWRARPGLLKIRIGPLGFILVSLKTEITGVLLKQVAIDRWFSLKLPLWEVARFRLPLLGMLKPGIDYDMTWGGATRPCCA